MTIYQEIARHIHGHLDPNETQLLYEFACRVPKNGVITELGSYQGRSTVILAKGAQVNGAHVWTIDCFNQQDEFMQTGETDHAALLANLFTYDVADSVRVMIGTTLNIAAEWETPIDLLFIDASHVYADVKADFEAWTPFVTGYVALHDTKPDGDWPGPVRVVKEAVDSGKWRIVRRADATTILERV